MEVWRKNNKAISVDKMNNVHRIWRVISRNKSYLRHLLVYTVIPTHLNWSILSSWYFLFIENLHKRQSNTKVNCNREKREDATQLFKVELRPIMIELLVPLVCAVYFLTAYCGQKSRIIGNFQNSGWQFKEVIDVENFVADCMDMFFDDLFSCCLSFQ